MNYLQTAIDWFNDLETKRKLSLALGFAMIILLTLLLSWWVLSPSYATLFNQLDEHDANKVVSQLEQENIAYQLRHDGSEILIDKDLVTKTRLKIMGSGLQLAGNVGFELFDKNDFGMTDFSQKINYQRALQGELERTISSIEEVRQARVHLVIPERRLFDDEENQPKAAITLNLKQKLSGKQVHSIQQLVAASIAHLQLRHVIVVDQNGNTLSTIEEDNSSSHFASKQNVEHYLNDKVMQILQPIFSKKQIMVKVNAEINYDELQRELVKPQTKGQITHEKEIKHSSLNKKGQAKGKQDLTVEKTYNYGSEKESFKRASGTVERLTVSVVLPQDTDAQTIAQVQRLVKNTVGFNEQRGDVLSVEALIQVVRPSELPSISGAMASATALPNPSFIEAVRNQGQKQFPLLLLLLIASTSSFVFLKRLRHKKRQQLLHELTHWLTHHES